MSFHGHPLGPLGRLATPSTELQPLCDASQRHRNRWALLGLDTSRWKAKGLLFQRRPRNASGTQIWVTTKGNDIEAHRDLPQQVLNFMMAIWCNESLHLDVAHHGAQKSTFNVVTPCTSMSSHFLGTVNPLLQCLDVSSETTCAMSSKCYILPEQMAMWPCALPEIATPIFLEVATSRSNPQRNH